jgi:hypothetical protein
VIAVAIATLGFADGAMARKEAAEKAQEGGIDHWIEYYKGEQRKPATKPPEEPAASPVDRTAPDGRSDSATSPREGAERK